MTFRSIRVRLTTWYLVMLALGLGVFGIGSWFAMRVSVFHSIDDELKDRIRGVDKFMQLQISALSPGEIRDEFREHSVLGPGGDLFQVCNEKGDWLIDPLFSKTARFRSVFRISLETSLYMRSLASKELQFDLLRGGLS